MKRRKSYDFTKMLTGTAADGCQRYGLGLSTMKRVAADAGAKIYIGRRLLLDFRKIDAYLEQLSS